MAARSRRSVALIVRRTVRRMVQANLEFQQANKRAERELGLSLVQYHLLHVLRDMPASAPQALAREIGAHPSTLTQSIKRLHRKRFLFVGSDPRDARKKVLSLTQEGERAIERFEREAEAVLSAKAEDS